MAGHCGLDLGAVSAIPDGGAIGAAVAVGDQEVPLILTRRGESVSVFVNRCPHVGVGLDWVPGRFMDPDGRLLQCAMHGAQFRPADGFCVAGPCAGQSLIPLPARVSHGHLWLEALPDASLAPQ